MSPNPRKFGVPVRGALFLAILFLALLFRVQGIFWDDGHLLHPDERFQFIVAVDRISMPQSLDELLSPSYSPWNPRRVGPDGVAQPFAYGALPLYTLEVTGWTIRHLRELVGLDEGTSDPFRTLAFRARLLTALVDLSGILFAMLLARRAFGNGAALLTGALLATSVLAVQQAHFFVVDPWAAAFGTATLFCAYELTRRGQQRWAVAAGVAAAAALACKVSMWPLVAPLVAALGWLGLRRSRTLSLMPWLRSCLRQTPWPTTALAFAVAYAVFEPYTVLDPFPTLRDVLREWLIAQGLLDVPYTRQYVETVPIVYHVIQLVRWGMGPVYATIAGIALLSASADVLRAARAARSLPSGRVAVVMDDRLLAQVLLLLWILFYGLTAWTAETKYLRYSLPLLAPLAILTSGWLVARWRAGHRRQRLATLLVGVLVLLQTFSWTLAFTNIYRQPHTRVAASQWILQHVPPGSTLGVEHWDDRLPLSLNGMPVDALYRFETLTWYEDRSPRDTVAYLHDVLERVDYIVLSSDRLAGSIPRMPWRYPVTSEYYRLLESGALGFTLVYEAKVESRFGPLQLSDYEADESFTVYDHPRVRIFRKERTLSEEELRRLFAWSLEQPYVPQRDRPEAYKQLLGAPVETIRPAHDLGWADGVLASDVAAVLWWSVLLSLLGLSALPLAVRVATSFPDCGVGLVRVLALILLAYPVWLLASWRIVPFELPSILLALLLVALVCWWRWWPVMRAVSWRDRVWAVALSEGAFWFGFGFFLFLRWLYPDLWHPYFGGEKPMELAFAQGVARSRWMPPYDPWFADGVQNYYYYGFFLVSLLWKLSGLLPERAFQLALATVAGSTASVVASLGLELARRVASRPESDPVAVRRWMVIGGAGSVWWVVFAGNLDPLLQVVTRLTWRIDFWESSRVVAHAITEFPYFSFLYGDLHPHVIALPIWLAAAALALALHRDGAADGAAPVLGWLLLVFCASTAAVVNSWDLPLAATLVLLGSFALIRPSSPGQVLGFLASAATGLVLLRVLYQPFYDRFVSPVTTVRLTTAGTTFAEFCLHFGLLLALPALALLVANDGAWRRRRAMALALLAGVATLAGALGSIGLRMMTIGLTLERVDVGSLLVLALAVSALTAVCLPVLRFDPTLTETRLFVVMVGLAGGTLGAWRGVAGLLLVACVVAVSWLVVSWSRPEVATVALGALGLAIVAASDLVVIVDDLYGSPWERMNTVFKLYNEAWPLLALAGWAFVVWAWSRTPMRTRVPTVLVGALVVCSALYFVLGTPQRLALRLPSTPSPGSLDGYAWMRGGAYLNSLGEVIETSEDWAVIEWLRAHAEGNPVILEASIGPYRGNGSRISSATGLPTVLGWDRHERQQRERVVPVDRRVRLESPLGDAVDRRLFEVRELYDTTDLARKRELLWRYRVRYVVVGPVERGWRVQPGFAGASRPHEPYASREGLAAFEALEGSTLRRVATFGETRIYEVVSDPPTGQQAP